MVPIFKGNVNIRNCSCHLAAKLLEHGIKVVERVLEKRLRGIVTINDMKFGLMPDRGTIDAVFIFTRLQEVYHAEGKKMDVCSYGPMKSLSHKHRYTFDINASKSV